MSATFKKTPNDVLPYDVEFHRWLAENDSLASATATISGGTAVIDEVENSPTTVRVWVSGGDDLDDVSVTVLANTNLGMTKEVCFHIRIRDCD